jgi:sulfonate transport system substrate-binding protein
MFGKRVNPAIVITLTACFVFMMFFSAGCAKDPKAPEKPKEINITYVKNPLNVPSIVEKHEQLLEKEFGKDDIEINLLDLTSGSKQTEAVAAGSLDICNALGGTSAILAAANGVDLKIISIYSRAPKAFMLVTKSPDINSIADLKGKKVAGPKGTVLHQLLLTALAKNNMAADDVQYIVMEVANGAAALLNGSVDAALVSGGTAIMAQNAGARVLTTGEGLIEGTIVVAVRGDFLKNYPDLVQRFKKVQQASLDYMNNNPEKTYQMTAEEIAASVDDVKLMLPWYDFDPEIKPSDIEELKRTQDFLFDNRMLLNKINIEDIIAKN